MAESTTGSKKPKKQKKQGTFSQIKQIYKFTRADDPQLPWLLAVAIVVPTLIAVLACVLMKLHWVTWIFTIVLGVMVGALIATWILTRRADKVGFKQLEGKPGATGAILSSINRSGFSFPAEPVWIDARTKDAVWRGSGRTGVYLVGEGDYGRVMKAINREEEKIKRITRGSAVPIHKISVGDGPNQIPLTKLQRTIYRQKVKLTKYELDELNGRLHTLQMRNAAMGMPKGVDPTKMHVSRRAMRGK